jgi:hypothetical protein
MGTFWAIAGIVLALGFGAVSLMGLSPPAFLMARICFMVAAILVVAVVAMWARKLTAATWVRIATVSSASILTPILLIWMWMWINGREAAAQLPATNAPPSTTNSPGNCNNYGLNSGKITNNCPTINQAPSPEIKLLTPTFSTKPEKDGSFSHTATIRITGLSNLGVAACGNDVTDVTAAPATAGMIAVGELHNVSDNCKTRRFYNVQGDYVIGVITTKSDSKFTATPVLLPQ